MYRKNRVINNAKYAKILFRLSALRFSAKYIGIIKPNTLLAKTINVFQKLSQPDRWMTTN